jgi:hypothetical protein
MGPYARLRAPSNSLERSPVQATTVCGTDYRMRSACGQVRVDDSGRLVEMRCDPGVGGRILEVYDAERGEGLELARITILGCHQSWHWSGSKRAANV